MMHEYSRCFGNRDDTIDFFDDPNEEVIQFHFIISDSFHKILPFLPQILFRSVKIQRWNMHLPMTYDAQCENTHKGI